MIRDQTQGLHEYRFTYNETPDIESRARLDLFLQKKVYWLSREQLQKKIKSGKILVNQKVVKASYRLKRGDQLDFKIETPITHPCYENSELQVLYEDQYCLAVDKPPGMIVHPTGIQQTNTLISLVHAQYKDPLPHLLNRIDKETSGLVLLSKSTSYHGNFSKLFEKRKVKKTYLTLVYGLPPKSGDIDQPIGSDPNSPINMKMAIHKDGLPSQTSFKRIWSDSSFSLLQVFPKTGRQHQIRVHLQFLGYPILRDKIYVNEGLPFLWEFWHSASYPYSDGFPVYRMCLHAYTLEFYHPFLKKEIKLKSPLPKDFRHFIFQRNQNGIVKEKEIN